MLSYILIECLSFLNFLRFFKDSFLGFTIGTEVELDRDFLNIWNLVLKDDVCLKQIFWFGVGIR